MAGNQHAMRGPSKLNGDPNDQGGNAKAPKGWWACPEDIVCLEGLWRAWEHLRLELAPGMSTWLRGHADPHMSVLLDVDGPFKGCTIARGHADARLAPLALEPAPSELFEAT